MELIFSLCNYFLIRWGFFLYFVECGFFCEEFSWGKREFVGSNGV